MHGRRPKPIKRSEAAKASSKAPSAATDIYAVRALTFYGLGGESATTLFLCCVSAEGSDSVCRWFVLSPFLCAFVQTSHRTVSAIPEGTRTAVLRHCRIVEGLELPQSLVRITLAACHLKDVPPALLVSV